MSVRLATVSVRHEDDAAVSVRLEDGGVLISDVEPTKMRRVEDKEMSLASELSVVPINLRFLLTGASVFGELLSSFSSCEAPCEELEETLNLGETGGAGIGTFEIFGAMVVVGVDTELEAELASAIFLNPS